MKIALAQLDVKAGRPKLNVARMLEMIAEAKSRGAELIAFPEMAVGGYLVGDKWTDDDYCRNLMECNDVIRMAADGIIVVWGNVYLDKTRKAKDGRFVRFNTVYLAENKKLNFRFKSALPNYRIFDDVRYFANPMDFGIVPTPVRLNNGLNIGLEVCEDMWIR